MGERGEGERGRCVVNGSELDWVSECVFGRCGRRGRVREWERAKLDGWVSENVCGDGGRGGGSVNGSELGWMCVSK